MADNYMKSLLIIQSTLQGTTDLLLHSSAGMNPKNPIKQAIKPIEGRRGKQKTEMVIESIEKADWLLSGIWMNEGRCWLDSESFCFEGYSQPALPVEYILRCTQAAATAQKLGKAVQQALSEGEEPVFPFLYDGPVDAKLMWDDPSGKYVDTRSVRVQASRIMRNRVRIPSGWQIQATFMLDSTILDPDTVRNILCDAGRRIGTADFRPKFGKFSVTSFDVIGSWADVLKGSFKPSDDDEPPMVAA